MSLLNCYRSILIKPVNLLIYLIHFLTEVARYSEKDAKNSASNIFLPKKTWK